MSNSTSNSKSNSNSSSSSSSSTTSSNNDPPITLLPAPLPLPLPLDIKPDRYAHVNYISEDSTNYDGHGHGRGRGRGRGTFSSDYEYDGDADDDHSFVSAREKVQVDLEFVVNPTVDRTRYTFDRLLRICDCGDEDEDEEEGVVGYNGGNGGYGGFGVDDVDAASASSEELLSVASHDLTSEEEEEDDDISYASSQSLRGSGPVPRSRREHGRDSIKKMSNLPRGTFSPPRIYLQHEHQHQHQQQQHQQQEESQSHVLHRRELSILDPLPPALDELTMTSTFCSHQDGSASVSTSMDIDADTSADITATTTTSANANVCATPRKVSVSAIQEIDHSIETIREIKARLESLKRFSVQRQQQKQCSFNSASASPSQYSSQYAQNTKYNTKYEQYARHVDTRRYEFDTLQQIFSPTSHDSNYNSNDASPTSCTTTSMNLRPYNNRPNNDNYELDLNDNNICLGTTAGTGTGIGIGTGTGGGVGISSSTSFDRVKEIKSRLRNLEQLSNRKRSGPTSTSAAATAATINASAKNSSSELTTARTREMTRTGPSNNDTETSHNLCESPFEKNATRECQDMTTTTTTATTSVIPYKDGWKMNQNNNTTNNGPSASCVLTLTEYEAAMIRASDNMVEALLKLSREVLMFLFAIFTLYFLYLMKRDTDYNSLQLDIHRMKLFARAITVAQERQWKNVSLVRKGVRGPIRRFFFKS